jgi:hypothetical protein
MASKEAKPLHIVSLQAENVKRLVAVSITPQGHLVEITGKNGQGKTSVLDSIWWALGGASSVQSAPIRKGQDKASIVLDLGEYRVRRNFTRLEDGSFSTQIAVENAEGGRLQKAQTLIESFLGSLTFDPLEFAHMKPRDQFDTLKGYVEGVDIEAIDAANRTDFAKRTDVNRQAKDRLTQADAIPIPESTPLAKVDESAITDELAAVGEFNATLERRAERREATKASAADKRSRAADHRKEAEALRQRATEAEGEATLLETAANVLERTLTEAPPLEAPKDAAEVRKRLEDAKRTNAAVDQADRRKALKAEAEVLDKESVAITARMEEREKQKRDAIAAAKLPVEGIEFAEGAILLNGVPFDQASDAEKLRASCAIAMASNPRLRVLRVRDGSLLDEDGLKLIAEMAKAADYQVWVERVDSSGTAGFVIEDGHVRHAPAAQAAAE